MFILVYIIRLSMEMISLDLATHFSLIDQQDGVYRVISVNCLSGLAQSSLLLTCGEDVCRAGAALPVALLFPLNLLARLRPANPTATQGAISPCGML